MARQDDLARLEDKIRDLQRELQRQLEHGDKLLNEARSMLQQHSPGDAPPRAQEPARKRV